MQTSFDDDFKDQLCPGSRPRYHSSSLWVLWPVKAEGVFPRVTPASSVCARYSVRVPNGRTFFQTEVCSMFLSDRSQSKKSDHFQSGCCCWLVRNQQMLDLSCKYRRLESVTLMQYEGREITVSEMSLLLHWCRFHLMIFPWWCEHKTFCPWSNLWFHCKLLLPIMPSSLASVTLVLIVAIVACSPAHSSASKSSFHAKRQSIPQVILDRYSRCGRQCARWWHAWKGMANHYRLKILLCTLSLLC